MERELQLFGSVKGNTATVWDEKGTTRNATPTTDKEGGGSGGGGDGCSVGGGVCGSRGGSDIDTSQGNACLIVEFTLIDVYHKQKNRKLLILLNRSILSFTRQ